MVGFSQITYVGLRVIPIIAHSDQLQRARLSALDLSDFVTELRTHDFNANPSTSTRTGYASDRSKHTIPIFQEHPYLVEMAELDINIGHDSNNSGINLKMTDHLIYERDFVSEVDDEVLYKAAHVGICVAIESDSPSDARTLEQQLSFIPQFLQESMLPLPAEVSSEPKFNNLKYFGHE